MGDLELGRIHINNARNGQHNSHPGAHGQAVFEKDAAAKRGKYGPERHHDEHVGNGGKAHSHHESSKHDGPAHGRKPQSAVAPVNAAPKICAAPKVQHHSHGDGSKNTTPKRNFNAFCKLDLPRKHASSSPQGIEYDHANNG